MEASAHGVDFIVIGDARSPSEFVLKGCRFYDLSTQKKLPFALAKMLPIGHYARKNLGYLIAVSEACHQIIETDDDNHPAEGFFIPRDRRQTVPVAKGGSYVNVYRYFSDSLIWPRGLPLSAIRSDAPALATLPMIGADCPIQQGLADDNPDVDAIYRLTCPLPQKFRSNGAVAVGRGSWCPFNSQNTTWWSDAFPLLYLPSFCSFRMTDIWRSFIAQRICWENDWHVLFHEPNVWQDRNEHDLMRDFEDEVPGYLQNEKICKALEDTALLSGSNNIFENIMRCYQSLIKIGVLVERELYSVDAWISDIQQHKAM